ncbi:MAG: PIN domain-containing protein [Bifidobacteriaceae bacterium]|jgi:predicted nucleic acid-binding protein|nr:PIN domain-containing protein [Bifidobacteriaceae bacterium]
MKALLDSNVIIDVMERREVLFDDSYAVVRLAAEGGLEALVPASSISDIYYIIRRAGQDAVTARDAIAALAQLVAICDTSASDVATALTYDMDDLEDAIVAAAAKREKADFIITRDERDFVGSPVPSISPADFLAEHGSGFPGAAAP